MIPKSFQELIGRFTLSAAAFLSVMIAACSDRLESDSTDRHSPVSYGTPYDCSCAAWVDSTALRDENLSDVEVGWLFEATNPCVPEWGVEYNHYTDYFTSTDRLIRSLSSFEGTTFMWYSGPTTRNFIRMIPTGASVIVTCVTATSGFGFKASTVMSITEGLDFENELYDVLKNPDNYECRPDIYDQYSDEGIWSNSKDGDDLPPSELETTTCSLRMGTVDDRSTGRTPVLLTIDHCSLPAPVFIPVSLVLRRVRWGLVYTTSRDMEFM